MNAQLVAVDNTTGSSAHWPLAPASGTWWAGLPVLFHFMLQWLRLRGSTWFVLPRAITGWLISISRKPGESENTMWNRSDATDTAARLESVTDDWIDIRASLGGDGGAYERLVRRYQGPIAAYMWRFTRDQRDLEELVQDVFVEAYVGLAKFAGRAPLLHWLKRIGTRVGYRYWKQRRRQQHRPLPADSDITSAVTDRSESACDAAELVHRLLAQLAPRDRLVMTLTYLEGCTVKEVAHLAGWTETMVKVQAYRARQRLAKMCAQMGIEL